LRIKCEWKARAGGQEKIPPNNSAKNFTAHLDKPGVLH
jgi:hypothetical protein